MLSKKLQHGRSINETKPFEVLNRLTGNGTILAWYKGKPTRVLLRREIPMDWGTTIDNLTPEINPFQYAIEIKCLTLKDQTSYLIPDG